MSKLKTTMKKFVSGFKTRSFRVGGYSIVAAVIVLAIAVAVNMLVQALPGTMTQWDITSNQLFTISEQTKNITSGLNSDVEVYWIVQGGQEDVTVENLLKRYEALSDRIHVSKKDPDVFPTFVQQYTDAEVSNNSLVVVSGNRSRYVDYYEIYEYVYTSYYSYDVNFAGESALTSAIAYVTSENLPKVYLLTGHGEKTMNTTFQTAMEKENMETAELSLLRVDEIPADAGCIMMYAPQSDISADEKDMLKAWLKTGGRFFLITDPAEEADSRPNLDALMAEYGITAQDGVVMEGNRNYYTGNPYSLLPNISSHTITAPLIESRYYVLLPIAQGLTVSDDLPDTVTVTELLTTSDSAYSKLAGYGLTTYAKEDGDIDGPFALAVAITDAVDNETEAKLVYVSSAALLDENSNYMVSGGNQDFFLNALGWMCEQESSITIHSKSLSYDYLTMDTSTASMFTMIVVILLPIGYLAIGIYTWIRRKRR